MVQLVTEIHEPGPEKSPIEKSSRGTPEDLAHEEEGLEAGFGNASVNQVYLHDHRMNDELEEYRERLAGSE
jgi:hypothetical protein